MSSSNLSTNAESAQTGSRKSPRTLASGICSCRLDNGWTGPSPSDASSGVKLPKIWGVRSCIFSPASYYHDGVDVVTQGGTQHTTFLGEATPSWVTLVPDINGKIIADFSSVVLDTVDGTKQYPLCQLGKLAYEDSRSVDGEPLGYLIYGKDVESPTCHAEGGFYWGPELARDQDTADGKVRTTLHVHREK